MFEIEEIVMIPKEAEANNEADLSSEMDAPAWAVVSFDECAASSLTYEEAAKLVAKLSNDVNALCIVTNDAAQKMFGKKRHIVPDDNSEDADKHFTETL